MVHSRLSLNTLHLDPAGQPTHHLSDGMLPCKLVPLTVKMLQALSERRLPPGRRQNVPMRQNWLSCTSGRLHAGRRTCSASWSSVRRLLLR